MTKHNNVLEIECIKNIHLFFKQILPLLTIEKFLRTPMKVFETSSVTYHILSLKLLRCKNLIIIIIIEK
jgi:hypothetical protein